MAKSFFKDILYVVCSNLMTFLGSIVTGLFVPMILGANDYGYYRIFVLYSSYTALLHFGFVDGILLKNSGKYYSDLNKKQFRSTSLSFIILELFISLIVVFLSLFIDNSVYSFLFVTVGINTFLNNIATYYQFLAQTTMNFSGYSVRSSVQSVLTIVLTLFVWLFYKINLINRVNYKDYIFVSLFISFIMLLMCMYSYRDITFGVRDSIRFGFKRLIKYCKIGIYLTIAYQISNLIMIIDNQLVSMFFKAGTYGKYSFSYSMTNTAITILNAVATVLLPHLKRDTFYHIISIYHRMISSMMLVVYLALLAYFPLCLLVHIILPEYIQSLSYLKVFLPELGITCSVTMITFNYYNALGKSKFYFYMSMVILAISAVVDLVMYMFFHTPMSIALGSFIAIFIWYMASEYFLVKWYHVQWIKNFVYMILMIGSFFLASMIGNLVIGFCLYLIVYLIISWFMFKSIIRNYIRILINKL